MTTSHKTKFKPFVAHAMCCDTMLLLVRPRAYVTCKCKWTSVDAGDGHYFRTNVHQEALPPVFYWQKKKGSMVMSRKGRKRS